MASITIDESKLDLIAEKIVDELDHEAREYDSYEYGLPMHLSHKEELMDIVKRIITENNL